VTRGRSSTRTPWRAAAIGLLALVGPVGGTGLAQTSAAVRDSSVAEEIRRLEFHLADLLRSGAFEEYEEHLTPDYVRTTGGRLQTREQVLAGFRAESSRLLEMTPSDLEVRVHGDAAVLTGRLRIVREEEGRTVRSESRFTKTFVREGGRWRLAALHGSPVAPKESR
jgi:ketosteroid isomerase-like protein